MRRVDASSREALLALAEPAIRRRVAALVGDYDDRAELIQRCLIKVWTRGATFRGESALGSWLYRVVYNEFVSWRRSTRRYERALECLSERWSQDSGSTVAAQALNRVDAERALSRVRAMDRRVLELRYLEDLAAPAIGEELGLADSSVRCRLHRLKTRLSRGEAAA